MGQAGGKMPKGLRALIQSALAALFVLGAFLLILNVHSKLGIASLAASAFIAFSFPKADSAAPRHMIGGYVLGVVCGGLCGLVLHTLLGYDNHESLVAVLFCALAVLLCTFGMIVLNCQHPPAAALTISMVLERDPLVMGLAMLGCIVALSLLRWGFVKLFGRYF